MKKNTEVTQMLISVSEGNKEAVNSLFPVVYNELQKMAQNQLSMKEKDTQLMLLHWFTKHTLN